jgi:hypothetical protein
MIAMKKQFSIYIGAILIVIFCCFLGVFHVLSPVAHFEKNLDSTTQAVFIGKTSITGSFHGYPYTNIPDNPIIQEIQAYPLIGSTTIENLDKVTVFNLEEISTANILELIQIKENAPVFTDVTITSENGPVILGTTQGVLEIESNLKYAVTAQVSLNFGGKSTPFLVVVSSSKIPMQYSGETAIIAPLYNTSVLQIRDTSDDIIWENASMNAILYIEDDEFTCHQQPPVYLFPITSHDNPTTVDISISPADPKHININKLVENVTTTAESLGITNLTENIQGLDTLINLASSVINGGMILYDSQGTILIDGTPQQLTNIGFARSNRIDITISTGSQTSTTHVVEGESRFFFLGDHLYTAQARGNDHGVTIPILIFIVWIFALVIYVFIRFYYLKELDEELDIKIKRFALIFHIVSLIIVFILLDQEINYQLGMSALSTLFTQGASLIVLAFLGFELILWGLGYVFLAFPLKMLANAVLRFFGVGKGGKGIGKGISAFGIWLFCVLYLQLMINLVFLVIQPGKFFQFG